jgi:AraC family transcriptional regulator of adaptative response / DNA-3-methyladenine glycosylase II
VPLLGFLDARAIRGVEEVRGSTYRRTLAIPGGPAVIALTPRPGGGPVDLDVTACDDGLDRAAATRAAGRVARRLFDLDADPVAIARTLGRDPALRPLVRAHRGIRVPGAADGFELVVRAIIGQQVSVPAARTMLGRIAERFGSRDRTDEVVATVFPGPDRLAEAPLEALGVTGRRSRTIRRIAAMIERGELDLTGRTDADRTIDTLLEVEGIGPWTAEYVRMRALGDPDAFPASDLGVRRAFATRGLDARPRAIADRAEAWRPFRAYAAMLLWTHEA